MYIYIYIFDKGDFEGQPFTSQFSPPTNISSSAVCLVPALFDVLHFAQVLVLATLLLLWQSNVQINEAQWYGLVKVPVYIYIYMATVPFFKQITQ